MCDYGHICIHKRKVFLSATHTQTDWSCNHLHALCFPNGMLSPLIRSGLSHFWKWEIWGGARRDKVWKQLNQIQGSQAWVCFPWNKPCWKQWDSLPDFFAGVCGVSLEAGMEGKAPLNPLSGNLGILSGAATLKDGRQSGKEISINWLVVHGINQLPFPD